MTRNYDDTPLHEQVKELEAEVGRLRRLSQEREKLINNVRTDVLAFPQAVPGLPLRDMIRDIRAKIERDMESPSLDVQITELNDEILGLRRKVLDMEADHKVRVQNLTGDLNGHRGTIERKQAVIDGQSRDIRVQGDQIGRQAKTIAGQASDLIGLRDRVATQARTIQELSAKLDSRPNQENATLVEEIVELEKNLRAQEDTSADQRRIIKDRELTIDDLASEVRKKNLRLQDLHRETAGLKDESRDLRFEIAGLKGRVSELTDRNNTQSGIIDDLRGGTYVRGLQKEIRDLQKKLAEKEVDISNLHIDKRNLNSDVMRRDETLAGLRLQITGYQTRERELRGRINILRVAANGNLEEVRRLKEHFTGLAQERAEVINRLQRQIRDLESDIKNLGGDEDHIPDHSDLEALQALRNFVSELRGDLAILKDDYNE